mmetsp:Transcript_78538/g.225069  ORF Transcript_78538/g.225069 Transcript_78538/m.225069 type:complete len:212 (+) Transcript_78538:662-1297(+)
MHAPQDRRPRRAPRATLAPDPRVRRRGPLRSPRPGRSQLLVGSRVALAPRLGSCSRRTETASTGMLLRVCRALQSWRGQQQHRRAPPQYWRSSAVGLHLSAAHLPVQHRTPSSHLWPEHPSADPSTPPASCRLQLRSSHRLGCPRSLARQRCSAGDLQRQKHVLLGFELWQREQLRDPPAAPWRQAAGPRPAAARPRARRRAPRGGQGRRR